MIRPEPQAMPDVADMVLRLTDHTPEERATLDGVILVLLRAGYRAAAIYAGLDEALARLREAGNSRQAGDALALA